MSEQAASSAVESAPTATASDSGRPTLSAPDRVDAVVPPRRLEDIVSDSYDAAEKVEETEFGYEKISPKKAEPEAKPTEPPLKPPVSWSESDKEMFASLPRATQERLRALEQERQTTHENIKKYQERYSKLDEVVKPYWEHWQRRGVPADAYFRGLLADAEWFDQDPVAATRDFLARKGVDISQLADYPQNGQQPLDPRVQQALHAAKTAEQRAAALEQHIARQQAEVRSKNQSIVRQFINEKKDGAHVRPELAIDDNGKHADPTFYQRWVAMLSQEEAARPEASSKELFEAAYDAALWSMPDRREKQLKKQMEKEAEAAEAKLKDAKRAASATVKSSSVGKVVSSKPKSLEDIVSNAYDESMGAGVGRV